MSKEKSSAGGLAAYTNKDFESADRLSRLRMYMIEPGRFELDEGEWGYYIRLEHAFLLIANELSRTVAIQKIKAVYPDIRHSEAVKTYEDATDLFGDLVDTNRRIRKGKLIERLAILADKAFEKAVYTYKEEVNGEVQEFEGVDEKWMEMTRRLLRDIAELEAYDKDDPKLDPAKFQIPKIIITSDPQAFLNSRKDDG